jgi:hypothetical protein
MIPLVDKIAAGHALNVSELMRATGYSRRAIKRIAPPLVCGKCRLDDFWKHVENLSGGHQPPKNEVAQPADHAGIAARPAAQSSTRLAQEILQGRR